MSVYTLSSPEQLTEWFLEDPVNPDPDHTLAALKHRQKLLEFWHIQPGDKVLEIGGGLGDFTVVLADAVGPNGHVVAVDPGPMDYGTPNLGLAHSHIAASPIGSRITFVQDDPTHYLSQSSETFTHVVFCHCIWYFAAPSLLPPMLTLALLRSPSLLITEYSMGTSLPAAMPHILTAITLSVLETCLPESSRSNIKNASTPKQIRGMAESVGWKVEEEHFIVPHEAQRDGYREAAMLGMRRVGTAMEAVDGEARKRMLEGLRDAVDISVNKIDGGLEKVRNMDVWVASFSRAEERLFADKSV